MLSEEKIRARAKSELKHYFNCAENEYKQMADRFEAKYTALVEVLELSSAQEDALWEEARKEYEEVKEARKHDK